MANKTSSVDHLSAALVAKAALMVTLLALAHLPCWALAKIGLEKRIYEVRTEGKPSGHYELQLTASQNGVDVVEDCEVHAKLLLLQYHYVYHAHEVWKANRLVSFESKRDDNFKHCVLSVQPSSEQLQLTINGKTSRTIDGDIVTSSYWFLPDPGSQKFTRKFLEIDTGRLYDAQLVFVGSEAIRVGDQTLNCKHYKLTGGDLEDLWFDEEDRLVRQSEIDAGHRTIIQLQSIARA